MKKFISLIIVVAFALNSVELSTINYKLSTSHALRPMSERNRVAEIMRRRGLIKNGVPDPDKLQAIQMKFLGTGVPESMREINGVFEYLRRPASERTDEVMEVVTYCWNILRGIGDLETLRKIDMFEFARRIGAHKIEQPIRFTEDSYMTKALCVLDIPPYAMMTPDEWKGPGIYYCPIVMRVYEERNSKKIYTILSFFHELLEFEFRRRMLLDPICKRSSRQAKWHHTNLYVLVEELKLAKILGGDFLEVVINSRSGEIQPRPGLPWDDIEKEYVARVKRMLAGIDSPEFYQQAKGRWDAAKSSSAGYDAAIGRGTVRAEDVERRAGLSGKRSIEEFIPDITIAVKNFFYEPKNIAQLISELLHNGVDITDISNIIHSIAGIAFGDGFTVQNRSVIEELTNRFYVINNKGVAKDKDNYCFGAPVDQEVFIFRDLIMKLLEAKERNRFPDNDIKRAVIALWVNASMILQQSTTGEVLGKFLAVIDKADILGILMDDLAAEYTEEPAEALNQELDARLNAIEPGYFFTPVLGSLCNLTSPVLDELGITNERTLIIGREWLGLSLSHWLADDARFITEGVSSADFDPSFPYQLQEGSERLIISANVYSLFDDWKQPLKAVYDSLEEGGVAVFIQNNAPHPRSIRAELEAKGYVYIPEIDAFFPNRDAANQVLEAIAKCNEESPSYGASGAFVEYVKLRSQLAINTEKEFHEIMLGRLASAGFGILKEGPILSRHIGSRQARHSTVLTNDGGCMEIPLNTNEIQLTSGNMNFVKEEELPQGYVLEMSLAHIIVAHKQRRARAPVLPQITTEGDEQVGFLDGTRPCEFLYNGWFTKLPEETQVKVKKALSTAFNELVAGRDYDRQVGRSLIIDLPRGDDGEIIPVVIEGKVVRAVKVKGATLKADQEITRYKNNPIVSVDFDILGKAVNNSELATPVEAMSEKRALSAYRLHKISMHAPVNMDIALGRARFHGKSFENKGVWAAVLGIEYEDNHYRFFDHLAELMGYTVTFQAPWNRDITGGLDGSKIAANLPEIRSMFTELGAEMRKLHEGSEGEEGIIYVTPYLGQISWMDGKIKIHDMEDSKHQAGMSLDQKIAYRLQDLRTVLQALENQLPELTAIIGRLESIGVNPRTLILDGYFRDDIQKHDALRECVYWLASEKYREDVMHKFFSRVSRNSEEIILLMERIIVEKERGGPITQLSLKSSSAGSGQQNDHKGIHLRTRTLELHISSAA